MGTLDIETYQGLLGLGADEAQARKIAELMFRQTADIKTEVRRVEQTMLDRFAQTDLTIAAAEVRMREQIAASEIRMSQKIADTETRMSERIVDIETRMSEKIVDIETRMSEKIGDIETRMSEKITAAETRMMERSAASERRLTEKITAIDSRLARLESSFRSMRVWMTSIIAAVAGQAVQFYFQWHV